MRPRELSLVGRETTHYPCTKFNCFGCEKVNRKEIQVLHNWAQFVSDFV
jgi:hypothetical protein